MIYKRSTVNYINNHTSKCKYKITVNIPNKMGLYTLQKERRIAN